MEKDQIIKLCDTAVKLIRTEYALSQEKMSIALGLSKKTLVEIEKGRSSLGWMGSAALCAIFRQSEILRGVLQGEPLEVLTSKAFAHVGLPSAGGGLWWQDIRTSPQRRLQQNIITQHYRLLDGDGNRIASSLNPADLEECFCSGDTSSESE